jgi:hypothetical protein
MTNIFDRAHSHGPIAGAIALTLVMLASTSANAQGRVGPIGRTLRDPGRTPPVRGPEIHALSAAPSDTVAEPRYHLVFVPGYQWNRSSNPYGAQLSLTSDVLIPTMSFTISGSGQVVNLADGNHGRARLDGELDPFSDKKVLGVPLSLGLGAEYTKTARQESDQEYFGELDATLVPTTSRGLGLSLGGVLYYDRLAPVGAESSSGVTFGSLAYIKLRRGTSLVPEYDFTSDVNGEDYFVVKLAQRIPSSRYEPTLILGAGKHKVYSISLKLTSP